NAQGFSVQSPQPITSAAIPRMRATPSATPATASITLGICSPASPSPRNPRMAPIRTSRPTMMSSTAIMVTPIGRRRGVCVIELLMIPPFVYDEHGLLLINRTGGDHNRESLSQRKLLPFPFKRTTTNHESQHAPEKFLPPFFVKRATNYSAISPTTNSCT